MMEYHGPYQVFLNKIEKTNAAIWLPYKQLLAGFLKAVVSYLNELQHLPRQARDKQSLNETQQEAAFFSCLALQHAVGIATVNPGTRKR